MPRKSNNPQLKIRPAAHSDLARMLDQHLQQFELAGGRPHRPARDEHLVRSEIDLLQRDDQGAPHALIS